MLQDSGGIHVFLQVIGWSPISNDILRVLHGSVLVADRFGWSIVGASGQLLERSIVDGMVGAPERLVFEGPRILAEVLEQNQEARRPQAFDGLTFEAPRTIPDLTLVEQAVLKGCGTLSGLV